MPRGCFHRPKHPCRILLGGGEIGKIDALRCGEVFDWNQAERIQGLLEPSSFTLEFPLDLIHSTCPLFLILGDFSPPGRSPRLERLLDLILDLSRKPDTLVSECRVCLDERCAGVEEIERVLAG
jgi:hypothetical protein